MKMDTSVRSWLHLLALLLSAALGTGVAHAAAPVAPQAPEASSAPEATEPPEAPEPSEEPEKPEVHHSDSDEFRFGQGVTVAEGEESHRNIIVYGGPVAVDGTHHGEITSFGGSVKISGVQMGDVVVTGGSLDVSGRVDGSIAVIGGDARLASTARVSGDVSLVGGRLHRDPGAVLSGGHVTVAAPRVPHVGFPHGLFGGLGLGLSVFAWIKKALLTLLVGLVVVALLPAQVDSATAVLRERWLACLGVGFVAGVAVFPLTPLFLLVACVGVVIPALFYQVAKYFGLVVLFIVVGEALGRAALKRELPLIPAFLLGLAVLSLIGLVAPAPIWLVYGWLGVGCALLTRFGTMRPWFNRPTRVTTTTTTTTTTAATAPPVAPPDDTTTPPPQE
jgi:cytoskeletal protein CcmA (bactofilin family)